MPRTQVSPVKILLDLGIDLDNLSSEEDYLSALKEGAAMLQVGGGKTDGRFKILTDEVRKVRASRKESAPSAGMKITKKRISAQKLLNPAKLTPVKGGEGGGDLVVIKEKVVSIEALLGEQYRLQEENAKDAKQEAEKKRRSLKESLMEGGGKVWEGIKKVGQKVIEPFKNIWNKILGFLGTILFGRAVMKIWDWFSKEENIGKIDSIFKFLKDWWPALLTAYLVFGNGLTRFALGIIAKLGIWTVKLMGPVLKGLLAAAAKMGPWGLGVLALGAGAVYMSTRKNEPDQNVDASIGESGGEETANALREEQVEKEENQNPLMRFMTGTVMGEDAERSQQIQRAETGNEPSFGFFGQQKPKDQQKPKEMNKGGKVPGSGNTDTVPAMLTPGEFVMSKGAVQKYGENTMSAMNAAGGGTNQPTLMMSGGGPVSIKPRGISYYSQGGSVSLPSMNFHSPIKNNFHSPIQHFQGGGGVKRIQVAQQLQKEINIGPMATKNPKVVVVDAAGGESADASQAQLPPAGNREIPSFDATAFRSTRKMEVLGISP